VLRFQARGSGGWGRGMVGGEGGIGGLPIGEEEELLQLLLLPPPPHRVAAAAAAAIAATALAAAAAPPSCFTETKTKLFSRGGGALRIPVVGSL
jgi:hypothetical protein